MVLPGRQWEQPGNRQRGAATSAATIFRNGRLLSIVAQKFAMPARNITPPAAASEQTNAIGPSQAADAVAAATSKTPSEPASDDAVNAPSDGEKVSRGGHAGGQGCVAEILAIGQATGLFDRLAQWAGISPAAVKTTATTLAHFADDTTPASCVALAASVSAIARQHDRLRHDHEALTAEARDASVQSGKMQAQLNRLESSFDKVTVSMARESSPATVSERLMQALPHLRLTHAVCICERAAIPCCLRPCFIGC